MRQPSCAEISRLPKLTEGIRSINFRRTTPGSIYRVVHAHKPLPQNFAVDPTHPALGYRNPEFLRAFPWRCYPGFKLRALPHGVLEKPTTPFPSPPYKLSRGDGGGRSVNMSLLDVAPRDVGGHVVRQDILRKIKTVVSLIVTRGADVEGPKGKEKVVFRGAAAPDAWIIPNWVYIIHPYDQVYNMPYTRLIPSLRDALEMIAATGTRLEMQWAKMKQVAVRAPRSQKLPPLRSERLPPPRSERLPPPGSDRLPPPHIEKLPQLRSERDPLPRSPLRSEKPPLPRPPKPPPSKPPPEPTKKEKAVQLSFTQALQRLSRPVSASSQSQQDESSEGPSNPPRPQKPSTLGSILDRHLKSGLTDSPWGSPLEGPYIAVREPDSNPPDAMPRRGGSKEP